MSFVKYSPILEIALFFFGLVVVAVVVVISSVIGGFSWVDLVWLATSTVQLEVSDYSQLSYHTVQLQLYRMISEKWSSWYTYHIWGNCSGYD